MGCGEGCGIVAVHLLHIRRAGQQHAGLEHAGDVALRLGQNGMQIGDDLCELPGEIPVQDIARHIQRPNARDIQRRRTAMGKGGGASPMPKPPHCSSRRRRTPSPNTRCSLANSPGTLIAAGR